jgi:molybdate transport system ATP-binding protein
MDEPLANLDTARKAEVLPYLAALSHRAGPPILYVTHSETEAAALDASVIPIDGGRVPA